jgi:hypothetical protein
MELAKFLFLETQFENSILKHPPIIGDYSIKLACPGNWEKTNTILPNHEFN